MKIEQTSLSGVVLLTPNRFSDDRGWFSETWNKKTLDENGINLDFVQDNHSYSKPKGTVRGLHFQSPPFAQDKLVRVLSGRVFDVAADIRVGSPTFGKWVGYELSAENGKQLLIPQGFLHGFVTLEDDTNVSYKCSNYYSPDCDNSVRFDDPELAIDWGIEVSDAVLSEKDAKAGSLSDLDSPFVFKD